MRRVLVSGLITAAIVGGVSGVLHLSNADMQLLMFPGVVLCVLVVLWPEMRPSIIERRRKRR